MSSSSIVVETRPSSGLNIQRQRKRDVPLSRLLLFGITCLILLIYALPILTFPPGRDQGEYLVLGQGLLDGKQPYLQLWDNKPPGIFIVYALIARVFGRVMWSVSVVDVLLLFVISGLLYLFAKPYLGQAGAAVSVVINAAWHSEMRYFWITQPETFQVLCVLAAFILLTKLTRHWRTFCFTAGALCGFGFWQKYNFVAFLPFLLFLPFWDPGTMDQRPPRFGMIISWRRWASRVAFLLTGFGAVIVAVLAWIIMSGAWPAMRESQFEVLPRYALFAIEQNPYYRLMALYHTYTYVGPATIGATLVAIVTSWRTSDLRRVFPIFLMAMAAVCSVAMQLRFHDYYFQICYPFFAGIWAYLTIRLYEGTSALSSSLRARNRTLAASLSWALFANIILWPMPNQFTQLVLRYDELLAWRKSTQQFYANYPEQLPFELIKGELEVVTYVQARTKSSDRIYLWGSNSLIYFLANKQPPTRFVLNLGIVAKWGNPSWKSEVMKGVQSTAPKLIIITQNDALPIVTHVNVDSEVYLRESLSDLHAYITQNYRLAWRADSFLIYEKN